MKKIFWWGLGLLALVAIIFAITYKSPIQQSNNQTNIQKETVRVGYREHGAYWPLFVGIENNFFAKENIEIEAIPFNSTNQMLEALVAGKIDASLGGVNTTVLAVLENKSPGEFKLFTLFTESKDKYFSAILVKADANINELVDLANKKVSTQPGSTTKFLFRKTINEKIAPAEAVLEQMDANLQLGSLESGQTEAAIVFEPTATIATDKGIAKILKQSLWYNDIMENCPVGGSVLGKKFLETKPELAKRFIKATNEAVIFGKNDNLAIQKAIAMYLPITINLAKKMPILDNHLLAEVDVNQLQSFFDLLLKEGEITKPVNVKDILLPIYAESK